MKNKIIILIFSLLIIKAFPQSAPIYYSSDYAEANDTFRISKTTTLLGFNFDTTGTNIIWDYSTLQAYTQYIKEIETPNSTGYIFLPPSFQNSLDLADPISDTIYLGSIQLSNVYNFFDTASSMLQQLAMACSIDNFTVKSKYTSADIVYKFPLMYGNAKDSSDSGYEINISSLLYYNHSQKRVNEVEGWGTLSTPLGTFSALKIKSTISCTDTLNVKGNGIPSYEYTIVEYKWMVPGKGVPVLKVINRLVSGFVVSQTAEYLDFPRYFKPTAAFTYYPTTPLDGQGVQFQNLTLNADTYNWNFGDPSSGANDSSTQVNPTHIFYNPGIYQVTLIASNPSNSDTAIATIVVADSNAVLAYFTYTPMYPCVGDTISFANLTYNEDSLLWNFGDGQTSNDTSSLISHVYNVDGNYTVSLIAYKAANSDTAEADINISLIPSVSFTMSDSVINTSIQFTNTSSNTNANTTYYWDFGWGASPSTSTQENPIVTYSFSGNKTIAFIVNNSTGCAESITESVYISDIISNIPIQKKEDIMFGIFPNPFSDELNVTYEILKASNTQIEIYDLIGNRLKLQNILQEKGVNKINISTEDFITGAYFLRIKINDEIYNSKLIKLN